MLTTCSDLCRYDAALKLQGSLRRLVLARKLIQYRDVYRDLQITYASLIVTLRNREEGDRSDENYSSFQALITEWERLRSELLTQQSSMVGKVQKARLQAAAVVSQAHFRGSRFRSSSGSGVGSGGGRGITRETAPNGSKNDLNCAKNSSGGTKAQSQSFLHSRLQPAPAWTAFCSFCCYIYIGIQGLQKAQLGDQWISTDERTQLLKTACLAMCLLYLVESIMALYWGVTTMFGWTRATFLLHHLPFALCVGVPLLSFPETTSRQLLAAYKRTIPLDLCTSFNESVHALKALGAPRWVELPRCLALLVLIVVLIWVECVEIWHIHAYGNVAWLKWHSVFTVCAPLYHTFDVIPSSLAGAIKTWKWLQSGANDRSATGEGRKAD